MAWYDNAVFYHIYPLGMTGAPHQNDYGEPVHRINSLIPWIGHIKGLGCNALYIGPLFESVGHGYETTDYYKLDSRLGTNEDLKNFVAECHRQGIRVILDGVFNHVGRDFFAFRDLRQNRENSRYRDWFCNVNFWNNNEYNDGFSYDNWGGYNLLVKLNQRNPEVQNYLCDAIRMWVREFDIDGLRLDAADVLDFEFMQTLRRLADEVKPEFWLMGEVIHGDYTRWANSYTLHSVTDYTLHKALYSGHNDHNYFEIAHTVGRLYQMGLNRQGGMKLYSFADNHDVERISTILRNKADYVPLHILLYTLPGIPSVYYGSEFGIEGRKERGSDHSLRPALAWEDYKDRAATAGNKSADGQASAGQVSADGQGSDVHVSADPHVRLLSVLGHLRQSQSALYDGDYRELVLTTRQYAFARYKDGCTIIVAVNNDDAPAELRVNIPGDMQVTGQAGMHSAAEDGTVYTGALTGASVRAEYGSITFTLPAHSGEIWLPEGTEIHIPDMPDMQDIHDIHDIPENTGDVRQASAENDWQTSTEDDWKTSAEDIWNPDEQENAHTGGFDYSEEPDTNAANSDAGNIAECQQEECTYIEQEYAEKEPNEISVNEERTPNFIEGISEEIRNSAPSPDTAEEQNRTDIPEVQVPWGKPYEEMTVLELQNAVLAKLAELGPVTDQMRRDVAENIWHDSLVNWIRSFQ